MALFVALGGGAYAALGPGSVGPAQLKSGAVTTKALRNHSVSRAKIQRGAVGAGQIRNGSVGPAKLAGGIPGTLVAYGMMTPEGIDLDHSSGFDDVKYLHEPVAFTCLYDLPAYKTAVVTPVSNGESAVVANLELPPESASNCHIGDNRAVAVYTYSSIGSALTSMSFEPFMIYLYR